MKKSQYKGKYFSVLGDSISTLAGYNPPDHAVFYEGSNCFLAEIFSPEDTWWGAVIQGLEARLLVNDSFSGSMVCKHPACQIESYGCSDERTGNLARGAQHPDVVMVLLGINDWGCGMQLLPDDQRQDLRVFSVAYETMLAKIKANYPQAEVWCLTLPRSCWNSHPQVEIPVYRAGGHFGEYCSVIRACAEKMGCRLVDIFDPAQPYDTIDGFHATADGMRTIARAVLRQLQ